MRRLLIALIALYPLTANAFEATVIKVADGDTVTVYADHQKTRVRIFGIDAPEHDQPGGTQATADMMRMVLARTVEVEPPPHHRTFPKSYDRIVGVVTVDGSDVGLAQLKRGDAWAYDHFHPPAAYDTAQAGAQASKAGLWADDRPVPPWDWRHDTRGRVKRDWR